MWTCQNEWWISNLCALPCGLAYSNPHLSQTPSNNTLYTKPYVRSPNAEVELVHLGNKLGKRDVKVAMRQVQQW